MNAWIKNTLRVGMMLAIVTAMVAAGLVSAPGTALAAQASPAPDNAAADAPASAGQHAQAGLTLPATTCTLSAGVHLCDVYAKTGTLALPDGVTVDIWGFTADVAGAAELPGPALIVNQNEPVEVTLHNEIPGEEVSLFFPGQNLVPDLTGVPTGNSATYTFTPTEPGTYLYEAGLTPNGTRQVNMGLSGALIVRPAAAMQANEDVRSAFTDEALMVVNEIDPAFNSDPAGFSMQDYKPKYWLINGKAYPQTDSIPVEAGDTLLVRYLNGSASARYMAVLGLEQRVLGWDSDHLPWEHTFLAVSEPLAGGQSMDALIQIPVSATTGTQYPFYNPGLQLHNAGSAGFGGILTFVEVMSGTNTTDSGPLATNVMASPDPVTPISDVTLSADLDESLTGGSRIDAWEYFIDQVGTPGMGVSETIVLSDTFVNVMTTVPAATISTLPEGDVTFYLRGRDENGNWGPVNSTVIDLVARGPIVRGLKLTPGVTNGTKPIHIQATGDATITGGQNVVAARYFIDTPGSGTGDVMSVNVNQPIASLTADIPVGVVSGLNAGYHTIYVQAQDDLGQWGSYGEVNLLVDQNGPTSYGTNLGPNPNNGTMPIHSSSYAIRLRATIGDDSLLVKAEGFLETPGADGTGFPLLATDGLYNSTLETTYADIPLTTIRQMAEGTHPVYFHGLDEAGNWGALASMDLIVDKTAPTVSNQLVDPSTVNGNVISVTLTATVNDTTANITAAEWFEGADPGIGNGVPMTAVDGTFNSLTEDVSATVIVSGFTNGDHTLSIRGRDAAGNWSAVQTVTLTVNGNNGNQILVDNLEAGTFMMWHIQQGFVKIAGDAALDGNMGLRSYIAGDLPAYVADKTPSAESAYWASFLFKASEDLDTSGGAIQFFSGQAINGMEVFGLEVKQSQSGPEVRAWVANRSGGKQYTDWRPIHALAATQVELSWKSAVAGSLELRLNGSQAATINAVDTSSYLLEEVKLGATGQLLPEMKGVLYYDNFNSMRSIPIPGPTTGNRLFLPLISR